jgi:hypothetical protein
MSRAQLTSTVEQNTGGAVSPYVAGKNFIINGGMDVWQRGTSFASPNAYTADRWYGAGSPTFSQDTTTLATGQRYSMKVTTTGSQAFGLYQSIETNNSIPLAGQTVVYSYSLAASVNSTIYAAVDYSTATDVAPNGTWTNISTNTISATTSMVRGSLVVSIPSTAKSIRVQFYSGTLASGVSIYIGAAQLEIGSVATPFSRAGGTLSGELTACQRYYFRQNITGSSNAFYGFGMAGNTTSGNILISLPVTMRVKPSAIDYPTVGTYFEVFDAAASTTLTGLSLDGNASTNETGLLYFTVASGLTGTRSYFLRAKSGASSYLGWSAEL